MVSWNRLVEVAAESGRDPDFGDLSDGEVADAVSLQARRVAAETARWIALVAELTVRGIWAVEGARTPGDWLSWKVGMAPSTARDHIRVGLALRSLPKVASRFAEGSLSYSKVRAITRVADAESQDMLLDWADSCPANELEQIIARTRRACRADGVEADEFAANAADPDDPDSRVEHVAVLRGDDGVWELRIRIDEVDGARLENDILWLARQQDKGEPPHVRRVHALLDAISAAVASVPADDSGEDRDRLVVDAVAIGAGAAAETSAEAPRLRLVPRVGMSRAPAMSVRTLQRLACSGSTVTVVSDEHGCPLDVGRAQRAATASQRKALLRRDGHCRFPGCVATRHLHAHHAVEWGDNGRTDMDNLVMVCGFHHRFIHNAAWQVRPEGHGLFTFVDTHGRVVAAETSAEAPTDLPVVRQLDTLPIGVGLQPKWWDGEPIDWNLCISVLADEVARRRHRQPPRSTAMAA